MAPLKQKVVLAYSGGLDTSCILKWLAGSYEVIAFIADVGQQEDFGEISQKALATGASKVYLLDLKQEFVEHYIFPALKAGAVYEGRYLLGTALARPLIASKQVEIAKEEKTSFLAHGCTGKGNDQVRFELAWMQFLPHVKVISPWKDPEWLSSFKGRSDLIAFAKENGIPVKATLGKPYSVDDNLMHTSYESGILEDPMHLTDSAMFTKTCAPEETPDEPMKLCIEFSAGIPVKVTDVTAGAEVSGALELFSYLNSVGGAHGVGRVDMVENRLVGIKSRGVYETPAGTILHKAHQDLEGVTLDREVLHLKEFLSPMVARLIYNGLWFSPEMAVLMAAIDKTQETVSGKVHLSLCKGNVIITGRESAQSLYDSALSSMDALGGFDQEDAKGFISILGHRLKLHGARAMGGAHHDALGKTVLNG